jgi:hypothetical protein
MRDVIVFKLDNTHCTNSFSDDFSTCMIQFLHCLLILDYSFAMCFNTHVCGIVRSLVDKNPITMSNLIIIKNIINI